jgi:O-antigen/teichoic acid export membrane protein
MTMSDEPPPGLKRIVLRGAGLAGAGHVLSQALNLGAYLVIARLVTPDEYGVYVAGSLVTGVGLSLSSGGLQAAVIQRRERVEEALNTAVVSSLAVGVALALFALATAPLVTLFFHDHRAGEIAAALSGWAVLRCAGIVPGALMQRRFSFLRRVVVEPFGILAFGIVSVVATSSGMGAWGLVVGTYASAAVQLVLSWALVRWRPSLRLASFATWLELASFARHLFASELLRRVSTELPAAVVGRSLGADALGQYRYGERFGTQPQSAMTNVAAYVLLPAFARIAADAERLRRAFLRALRWIVLVAAPAGFILLPLGEPLAVALLGERWHGAGSVMMALCAYTAAGSLVQVAVEAFKVVARPDLLPRVRGLTAAATVAGVTAGLPFGIAGVAAGVSAAGLVTAVYAAFLASRILGIPLRAICAELWAPLAASLVMVGAVAALDRLVLHAESHAAAPALGLLAVEMVAGALVYLTTVLLLAPATVHELWTGLRAAARGLGEPGSRRTVLHTRGG